MEVDAKDSLATLLKDSGYAAGFANEELEKLPLPIKKRVCALKALQLKSIEIESKFYERVHQLEKEFEEDFNKVYEQRRKIVVGEHEPADDEANVPLVHGLEEADLKAIYDKSEPDTGAKGIPDFWLRVLRTSDIVDDMLQEHDEPILSHLLDITATVETSPPGFTLHFHFSPNPFFKNTVLTKKYELMLTPDKEDPFDFEGPTVVKSSGCAIDWLDGKNITKKVVKKKAKKGPNAGKFLTKTVKADSFFNFFDPPVADENKNEEDDEDVETQELIRTDFEIGQVLRDHVIPRAVLFYTGESDLHDDEFDFGDDEDEDEEDGSEDDE